ncbi:heme ABC transporter ATP-binding protein [Vibrio agarivorans]|uniref:heme ABC transporter ATP-binding protein n=1 Tax=Vibrio agarivorans TaxID=153622 RepID=UPI00223241D1|nr:heme ABC transporter ATP-binding protein [Vibrio agarivorans]MDN3662992.1 heme ABC transporter ATP-binding protein [Vibrio agarivorans]
MSAIAFSDLNLTLGKKTILKQTSASIKGGEFTILLGPNGTGKSSLLKLISREWQTKGQVSYFGRNLDEWNPAHLAKHVGVLPQHSNLTFAFTAREVVELGGLNLHSCQKGITKIASQNMQRTEVTHLADRLFPSLSGGEKQRVHLARVLTQISQSEDKCALLLDEPTSALDLGHQHRTLQLAKEMANQGSAVVAVIHDLNLAAQYGDRLIVLNEGQIAADGTPEEVLTPALIESVYNWKVNVMTHPSGHYPIVIS